MRYVCQRESIAGLWDEVMPLLVEHWREIAKYQDIVLDPARQAYQQLEGLGQLRIYTLREADVLIGYAAFFLRTNLHYQGSLQAWQDVLYVDKRARGTAGIMLIRYAERELAAEGAQVVYHHAKLINQFGLILKALGYELVDEIYAKRLDA